MTASEQRVQSRILMTAPNVAMHCVRSDGDEIMTENEHPGMLHNRRRIMERPVRKAMQKTIKHF